MFEVSVAREALVSAHYFLLGFNYEMYMYKIYKKGVHCSDNENQQKSGF